MKMFAVMVMTRKLLPGIRVAGLMVVCVPPIVSSSIFHPVKSTANGFWFNSSTHSEPLLGLGMNSFTTIPPGYGRDVGVSVGVSVSAAVGVSVPVGVFGGVAVRVGEGVWVDVAVPVGAAVSVAVGVSVGVEVIVAAGVSVGGGVSVGVAVGMGV